MQINPKVHILFPATVAGKPAKPGAVNPQPWPKVLPITVGLKCKPHIFSFFIRLSFYQFSAD